MPPPLGLGGFRRLRADLAFDEVAWATSLAVFRVAFLIAGALPTPSELGPIARRSVWPGHP